MRKLVVLLAAIVIGGCGESDENLGTIRVRPGQSIQAALDAAPPNASISVEPGVYHESSAVSDNAVSVDKDGIQLIGLSTAGHPVVLENSGTQKNGIVVTPPDSIQIPDQEHPPCGDNGNLIHGFTLKGFTLRNFDQYGIYLACNDGFTLAGNVADGNQVYGLFPVRSQNGTVTDNETLNTPLDAAIYVGQSSHVTIADNVSHDSLIGIEVENSSDVQVTHNQAFNDTVGLLADVLPGLQKKDQQDVLFADNDVHDNNRRNTADPEDITSAIPTGTGILVLSGSTTTVQHNTVTNNGFGGIVMASYCTGVTLLGEQCTNLDIDPNPKNNRIVNNQLTGNGLNPPEGFLFGRLAADLIWDGMGSGNCWAGNTPSATVKLLGGHALPSCQ